PREAPGYGRIRSLGLLDARSARRAPGERGLRRFRPRRRSEVLRRREEVRRQVGGEARSPETRCEAGAQARCEARTQGLLGEVEPGQARRGERLRIEGRTEAG